MIDFIGDIHGHADKLEALLNKLGYSYKNGSYSHSDRKVIFVGDYIDRGAQIIKTLEIVKSMVESENAVALLGNHEYNAICFHYQEKEGGHLRKHLIKNIIQHYQTLQQFQNKQEEYEAYLEWFKNLPLFYETEQYRAVHACWDINNIKFLRSVLKDDKLNEELIIQSVEKGTPLYTALNNILKGKEIKMPAGHHFIDKDGTARTEIRIKWWEDPTKSTYKRISVEPIPNLPEIPIAINDLKNTDFYNEENKPVFFGHYWLKGNPSVYRSNICCLDYSIAKGGHLVAYRFDGEVKLDNSKLVYV